MVSQCILKTLIIKYDIYANIFAEKNVSSFCICKSYSHFFSKNTCELDIVLNRIVNILTTTNDALNNWALFAISSQHLICHLREFDEHVEFYDKYCKYFIVFDYLR